LANILSNAIQRLSRTQRDRRAQKLTSRDFNATGHKITTKYGPVKLLDLGVEFVQREDKSKERFPLRPRICLLNCHKQEGPILNCQRNKISSTIVFGRMRGNRAGSVDRQRYRVYTPARYVTSQEFSTPTLETHAALRGRDVFNKRPWS